MESRHLPLDSLKTFKAKSCAWLQFGHVGALTSQWEISTSLCSLLPGGGRFLLNQMDGSLRDPAFVTRRFVRVSVIHPQDCHSDYTVFTMDFCLLVLTVKAPSQ